MTKQIHTQLVQFDAVMDPVQMQAILTEARRQRGLYFARTIKALGRTLMRPLAKPRQARVERHSRLPHSA